MLWRVLALATPDTGRGEQTRLISHILPPAAVISAEESAGEQLQLGRELRAEITFVEVGHEAVH